MRRLLPLVVFWHCGCPGLGTGVSDADLPDVPTWVDDVGPLLELRCVGCHSEPPAGGAPDSFRLDLYEGDGDDLGALDMLDRIEARAVEQDPGPMPPTGALAEAEVALLARWIEVGAPETQEEASP